jgi:hypothetical protein
MRRIKAHAARRIKAHVFVVLAARDDKQIPSSNCVGVPIIGSDVTGNPCF